MSNFPSPLLFLFRSLCLCLMILPPVQTPAPPAQVTAHLAVVLLVDNSGSMEANDPDGVRFTAARLFSALLDEGDQMGVIMFATEATALTPGLVTVCSYADCPVQSASKEALAEWLSPVPEEGYTDVKAAFQRAAALLQTAAPDAKKAVILLTDGKPEILHPYAGYEAEALTAARQLNVPVLALGLTPAAQTPFLGQVATETGGQLIPVANAAALLDAYLQLFGQVKDRTVMYPDESGALWIDPALTPFIQTISFIALSKGSEVPRLVGPGAVEILPTEPQVAYLTHVHGLAVLALHTPPGGEWRFRTSLPSEEIVVRAIVTSRLRLQVELPALVHPLGAAAPIRVTLLEETAEGEPITIIGEASFSATITRPDGSQEKLSRFYDDGTHGDRVAGDGEYAYLYTPEQTGSYHFELQAWKGIIPIQTVANLQVAAFPWLEVNSPAQGLYQVREAPISLSVRFAGDTSTYLFPGQVVAQVVSPSGLQSEVPLVVDTQGNFSGAWMPQENGLHQVQFSAPEANYLGVAFTPQAAVSFEVQHIAQIHVANRPVRFGLVETGALPAGLAFSLTVTLTTVTLTTVTLTAETTTAVQVSLEDLPGLSVQPEELHIPPGSSTLSLLVSAQTLLAPRKMAGLVRFSVAADTDTEILPPTVPLELEIFQPTVVLPEQAVYPLMYPACPGWTAQVSVPLSLTSQHEEWVFPALADEKGYTLEPKFLQVKPGENTLRLILTPTDVFRTPVQTLKIDFSGREGLAWSPANVLFVPIQSPTWWARCGVPFQRGLSGLIALGIGLLWAGLRIRATKRSTVVTGTLRHWPVGKPGLAEEIDLTSLRRTEIRLGRGPACEIAIADPQLAEVHAILRTAQRQTLGAAPGAESEKTAAWVLEPVREVRAGYRPLKGLTPLYSETMLVMGGRVYQFFADH